MTPQKRVIAFESRLKGCKNVVTLGVRPNFSDYTDQEIRRIRDAPKIYYPTVFYADLFDAMGKKTFPSYHTYKCVQDKIKQTALFDLLGISHPKTRVFYGKHQKSKITENFDFPFVAKIPRGSAMGRGVYLIHNPEALAAYNRVTPIAYIQEFLPIDRDIRVIVIGEKIVHSYWRIVPPGEFRSNVALGGGIRLDPVPSKVKNFALKIARVCGWNDVGLDICQLKGKHYVLEANMKYGKEGFKAAGIDYIKLMETMIENGDI